ncbi:MAG: L-threonylcarbamoyladenylate synthase [bacterium]
MNKAVKTKVISINPEDIEISKLKLVVSELKKGKVIVFLTDTLYGLGVDFENHEAVKRIFQIKERSIDKPLLLLISEISEVSKLAINISPSLYELMSKFWPGPLTLVLKAKRKIFGITSDDGKIALRMPNSPMALTLIKYFNKPLTAPSANLSEKENLLTEEEIERVFEGKVDLIVKGGRCKSEKPSTLLDCSNRTPVLLREGVLSFSEILKVYRE